MKLPIIIYAALSWCPGDMNHDNMTDAADVPGFVAAVLEGDPAADVTGDGSTDGRDVAAFVDAALTNWGEGRECHPVNAIAPCDPCSGVGVRYVVRDMPLPPEYGPACETPGPWSSLCVHGEMNCPYGVCLLLIDGCYLQAVAYGECGDGENHYEVTK